MTTIIKVTSKDIKRGEQGKAHNCPVALALKRKFPNEDVAVVYYYIRISDRKYATNEKMQDFIGNYDIGISVKPFSFDLDKLKQI